MTQTQKFLKRQIDFWGAMLGVIILAAPGALIAILIKLNSPGPVFFRQIRPGLKCKLFNLIKFRTMDEQRDKSGNFLPDKDRITPFGNFLRRSSIDEIPELLNVIKGDMSLVGPRPLLPQYLERYNTEQMRRHEIKPGITGWAQINGRNILSWEEKFKMDVWYVDHQSFGLDLTIILRTFMAVLRKEGINQPGQATMEEFLGNTDKPT